MPNSKQFKLRLGRMSKKSFAISTIIALVAFVAVLAFFFLGSTVLQEINLTAALAAITVAAIGIVWFKKTRNN
jgi:uncharacterized phage infection (PIP) family protein YhgE